MKKYFFILLAIIIPVLAFTSCGSEDDEVLPKFSPVGKTYSCRWKGVFGNNNYYTYNVRFINDREYEFTYKQEDRIIETNKSTYTLNYPKVYFKSFGTKNTASDENGEFLDENTFRVGSKEYTKK